MKRLVSYTPVLAGLLFASASIQAATVTLATSPNPSNYGQAVTLTATLSPAATGKVTFYDGVDILGSADVNGTTAVLSTITLRSGVRSLRAFHTGDANNAPASSPAVSHTVVTAPSLGFRAVVAAENLLTGSSGNAYTADFNNDSKLDVLAVEGSRIGFLRGNGDGTFLAATYTSTLFHSDNSVAIADFNRDGRLDVALASSSGLAYLPGNGDGTFQTAVSVFTGRASGSAGDNRGRYRGPSDPAPAEQRRRNVSSGADASRHHHHQLFQRFGCGLQCGRSRRYPLNDFLRNRGLVPG
jgi:hypothetical protein